MCFDCVHVASWLNGSLVCWALVANVALLPPVAKVVFANIKLVSRGHLLIGGHGV